MPSRRAALGSAVAAAVIALGTAVPTELFSQAAAPAPQGPPRPGAQAYADNCAGCHGAPGAAGVGRAPNLFEPHLLSERSDEQLHSTIQTGRMDAGMPSFKGMLADDQIWQVITYLRTQSEALKGKPAFVPDPTNQVIKSAKQTFRIEVVAAGLDTPWGEAFLPDGRLLVTERSGGLRIIGRDGKLDPHPVSGTPKVWVRQDAGMMDVAVHPDWRKNGWIYLTYAELAPGVTAPSPAEIAALGYKPGPPSMTVVVRGRINAKNQWVDQQTIFRAPAALYTGSGAHYGSRLLFDKQGHLFFTLGERGEMTNAQKLDNPLGKIHRVNDDGSIPADNPFVKTPGAWPSIWSYGHRNPQGLSYDPRTGLLWETEHGPTGGDEVNIIEKGHNYGWGVATMGIQPGITQRTAPGTDAPIVYYTPTIAPSGISFYSGTRYPGWKDSLFVAALAGQQLRRLEISGRKVVSQEVLFQQFGRTRAVITGPDGLLYVLLQNPTGAGTGLRLSDATPGMVIRLVPVK